MRYRGRLFSLLISENRSRSLLSVPITAYNIILFEHVSVVPSHVSRTVHTDGFHPKTFIAFFCQNPT